MFVFSLHCTFTFNFWRAFHLTVHNYCVNFFLLWDMPIQMNLVIIYSNIWYVLFLSVCVLSIFLLVFKTLSFNFILKFGSFLYVSSASFSHSPTICECFPAVEFFSLSPQLRFFNSHISFLHVRFLAISFYFFLISRRVKCDKIFPSLNLARIKPFYDYYKCNLAEIGYFAIPFPYKRTYIYLSSRRHTKAYYLWMSYFNKEQHKNLHLFKYTYIILFWNVVVTQ